MKFLFLINSPRPASPLFDRFVQFDPELVGIGQASVH